MNITNVINCIEKHFPLYLQDNYDHSGAQLIVDQCPVNKILLCFDVTEEVMNEAIEQDANLIISHHPLLFTGIKEINTKTEKGRIIEKAFKHSISIYAIHTNLDNHPEGINYMIASKLNLNSIKTLSPIQINPVKLIVFTPLSHVSTIQDSLFAAGAGNIGNYSECSYNLNGYGTFKANELANPFVGKKNERHSEEEVRTEVIVPKDSLNEVIQKMRAVHPYEEPAFDIIPLENTYNKGGAGIIGNLSTALTEKEFLNLTKSVFGINHLRHSKLTNKPIQRIAACGGSGSSLIEKAINEKAEVFITGDIKYHTFEEFGKHILLLDIGHYESEIHGLKIIFDLLIKNFPTFAIRFSEKSVNPVYYY